MYVFESTQRCKIDKAVLGLNYYTFYYHILARLGILIGLNRPLSCSLLTPHHPLPSLSR